MTVMAILNRGAKFGVAGRLHIEHHDLSNGWNHRGDFFVKKPWIWGFYGDFIVIFGEFYQVSSWDRVEEPCCRDFFMAILWGDLGIFFRKDWANHVEIMGIQWDITNMLVYC